MSYTIRTTREVDAVAAKWKKSNPDLFKKYGRILHDISETPRQGIGHPEPLKGGQDITWSRRIGAHERIIYDIHDNMVEVLILELGGHYKDK